MIKAIVRSAFRAAGVDLRRYSLFKRSIELLAHEERPPFFVQIGANNGVDFDDLYALVTKYDLPGVVIEPLPFYFETLEQVYKTRPHVRPIRAAIHPTAREIPMYRVDPAKVTVAWQHGIASLSRDLLLSHQIEPNAILEETVPCLSLQEVARKHVPAGTRIDILACDTEGFDDEIMKMVDLVEIRPRIIRFESKHLARGSVDMLTRRLRSAGYRVVNGDEDCVAVDKQISGRLAYFKRAIS